MRGLSFAESRSKLGSSMAVRKHRAWLVLACARARAACVPRLGTLSLCTVAHNTHAEGTGHPHGRAAQALCLSGCETRPRRDYTFFFFGNSSSVYGFALLIFGKGSLFRNEPQYTFIFYAVSFIPRQNFRCLRELPPEG